MKRAPIKLTRADGRVEWVPASHFTKRRPPRRRRPPKSRPTITRSQLDDELDARLDRDDA
jgi:hypothetical protein